MAASRIVSFKWPHGRGRLQDAAWPGWLKPEGVKRIRLVIRTSRIPVQTSTRTTAAKPNAKRTGNRTWRVPDAGISGGSHAAAGRARSEDRRRSAAVKRKLREARPNLASRRAQRNSREGSRRTLRKSGERGFRDAGPRSLRSAGDRPRECRSASRSRPAAAAESDERPEAGRCRGSPCGGGLPGRAVVVDEFGRAEENLPQLPAAADAGIQQIPPRQHADQMSRRIENGKSLVPVPSFPTASQRRALSTVCVEESVTTGLDAMSPTTPARADRPCTRPACGFHAGRSSPS